MEINMMKRLVLFLLILVMLGGCAMAEYAEEAWYGEALKESEVSLGNNLRLRRGWKGKAAAIFAVIGFVCVIFTYIGVNTFLPGIHSYA